VFYVKRERDETIGWVGPIDNEDQARREVAAWQGSGWESSYMPATAPGITAEVNAWQRAADLRLGKSREKRGTDFDQVTTLAAVARVLGRLHASDGINPYGGIGNYGDISGDGEAYLMSILGQTDATTEDNAAERQIMLDAYVNAWDAVMSEVFGDQGHVAYEATCTVCGETFNPCGRRDLTHLHREDESECGGLGRLAGAWG
jgi:hypothetical protein